MKIPKLPFTTTHWSQVPSTEHSGETGRALWRTLNIGDVRVRMVEYTPRLPRGSLVRPRPHPLRPRRRTRYGIEGWSHVEADGGHELSGVRLRRRCPSILDKDRREAVHRGLT